MPKDRARFCEGVKSLRDYSHIHLGALGLQTDFPELTDCPNFHTIMAPVYVPFDLPVTPEFKPHIPLRLGFFGQYRREKNLDFFLKAFIKAHFTNAVELVVQGATVTQADSDDFERLKKSMKSREIFVSFIKTFWGLSGRKSLWILMCYCCLMAQNDIVINQALCFLLLLDIISLFYSLQK